MPPVNKRLLRIAAYHPSISINSDLRYTKELYRVPSPLQQGLIETFRETRARAGKFKFGDRRRVYMEIR